MIVFHLCVPEKNLFQIYRLDLEFFLDHDLLGGDSQEEKIKVTIAYGKVRQKLRERILGPYRTTQMAQLMEETWPLIHDKIKKGYHLAVAKGMIADRFQTELALVSRVQPWELAATYEKHEDERLRESRHAQEQAYIKNLAKQGQQFLPVQEPEEMAQSGFLNLPRVAAGANPTGKGPTPRSRFYKDYISKLGQLSLFDDQGDNF